MKVGTKEFYEMIETFEKSVDVRGRLGKEPPEIQRIGQVYQDGEVNQLWKAFSAGYSAGRCVYRMEAE